MVNLTKSQEKKPIEKKNCKTGEYKQKLILLYLDCFFVEIEI
jgi:hypothetical protein